MVPLSFGHTLLEFYNVIFLCSFAFALIFLLMQALGIMGETADLDADVDADVDADTDTTKVDIDIEHHPDSDGRVSVINKILSFFGIGKAPIGIWLFVFFFVFGLAGLVSNLILYDSHPGMLKIWFPYILFESFSIALFLSKYISRIVAKLFPKDSSHSISSKYELIHKKGKVRFGLSLKTGGSIAVIDAYGNLQNVQCHLDPNSAETLDLQEGTEVQIMDYDDDKQSFIVTPIQNLLH